MYEPSEEIETLYTEYVSLYVQMIFGVVFCPSAFTGCIGMGLRGKEGRPSRRIRIIEDVLNVGFREKMNLWIVCGFFIFSI
jgi:Mn2+/Fe2+ NRAMP family transporter